MAEGFEPYHVPQQSRRDKLRVLLDDNNSNSSSLQLQNCQVPLYDPSIVLPSDLSIFQEINVNPFLYTPQIPRFLDQSVTIAHNNNSNSNTNGQGNLSLSLSSLHHASSSTANNNDLSSKSITTTTNCVPLGPFTGYSLILKRSKFLKPAQILLEELCDVGKGFYVVDDDDDSTLVMHPPQACSNGDEQFGKKKTRLISMLDEVYQKYTQYNEQLQIVVASFESVAGIGNAAPFANIAIKTMSKHFKCLKDAITDQLQFTTTSKSSSHHHGQINCERVGISGKGMYCQKQETQPVWRPQRGLPERAVTVLRAWLFDHFLHPYPTDTDKVMLAKQTGLSRNQVSNWFINARVRLWKPMVEEIHMLETREADNKSSQREGQNNNNNHNNNPNEHFPMNNSHACESSTPSTSTPRLLDVPSKRTRNDLANIPNNIGGIADSINLSYGNMSTGVGGGVSLTLGLHQNSGNIGLSEPFPINAARRFGIESNTNSTGRFMFGAFDEQNGQFGRNNTMVGGQFLHDFAG
ncbi:BEL1-like homeodomain protein 9 [Capsicum baccatum]|uniref:BEL1-like homeodomain protein 9 n=1 Tax=Capsicum baccatum TaxID=33114 RepID=A0A2G2VXF9_CAPBA|nr:BEL1-like homeodomain protein 9 [Capsicum baccatum]